MGDGKVIWPLILEKAFAKMQGNYMHIEAGISSYGVRYMRGAPYEKKMTDFMTTEEIYDYIKEARSKNHNITAGPRKKGKRFLT